MLRAAPHRGSERALATRGSVALGVANDPSWVDSWIAEGQGHTAAFSGTLDNRPELEREVAAADVRSPAESPAGLVLQAFLRWGEGALPRLRGTFVGRAHRRPLDLGVPGSAGRAAPYFTAATGTASS